MLLDPNNNSYNFYNNLNINATNPIIDSVADINIDSINITYNYPVSLSMGNISIYQHDFNTNQLILRQMIPANSPSFISLSEDKKNLKLEVLNSTFNMPESHYTVVVDDDTVKDLSSEEPLLGIPPDIWRFTTGE